MPLSTLSHMFQPAPEVQWGFFDPKFQYQATPWAGSSVRGAARVAQQKPFSIKEEDAEKLKSMLEPEEDEIAESAYVDHDQEMADAYTEYQGNYGKVQYPGEDTAAYSIRQIQDWIGGLFQ